MALGDISVIPVSTKFIFSETHLGVKSCEGIDSALVAIYLISQICPKAWNEVKFVVNVLKLNLSRAKLAIGKGS